MSEFIKKYNKIIKDIEKNIQNEEDIEFAKLKINEISTMFINMLEKISKYSEAKINEVEENQKNLEQKLSKIQNVVEDIKSDIYDEYNEQEYEFEIVCPYCNNIFTSNIETDVNQEIKCPECLNIIELDWNEEESCSGSCSSCSGCSSNNHDDIEQYENMLEEDIDEDDDM